MNDGALVALGLSARVALCATLAILPPGIALGWLLARREVPGRALLETLTALPLVLPPTAIGYLLLRLLARDGPLGERALGFDLDLLFTWKGAVLASAVMALPLVVRTAAGLWRDDQDYAERRYAVRRGELGSGKDRRG